MKIVLLEDLAISSSELENYVQKLESLGHTFVAYPKTSDLETLKNEVKDADVVMLANMPFPLEALEAASHVQFIDVAFTGVDHIPGAAAKEKGITISNASGYATEAVAELVLSEIIFDLRKLAALQARGKKGLSKEGIRGQLLQGKTIGIVGAGVIGREIARLCKAFGCKVLGYNRSTINDPNFDAQLPLEDLLTQSDIVTLHVPFTGQTKGLIGKEQLKAMKPSAILVNTARGPIVDEKALIEALQEGTIAGAILDVFDQEPPLPADYPLLELPNVILTPHIGFDSQESMALRAQIVFDNLFAWLDHQPQNVI